MKVQIEDKLFLESNSYQFILKRYTGRMVPAKRTGELKEESEILGYFPTVESAMLRVLSMKVKESTATSLRELIIDVKRIKAEINQAITF